MSNKQTIIFVSSKLHARWAEFVAALAAAAKPFTGADSFAIGVDRAYEINGFDAEIEAALDRVRNTLVKPGTRPDVSHEFILKDGVLHHKLSWFE